MHLAYVDDSGSDPKNKIVVIGAIIVPNGRFGYTESTVSVAVEHLIPPERIEQFEEFHASELYFGHGVFEGLKEYDRHTAITILLHAIIVNKLTFIYSAIDRDLLSRSPLGSANPVDTGFRMCLLGIEDYARQQHEHYGGGITVNFKDMCLVIVDDADKDLKKQLRSSFRTLRPKWRPSNEEWAKTNRLWHVHDEFYFGDSKESVGLQLADLCSWLTLQHLKRRIPDEFFDALRPHIVCAKPEPEWTQLKSFLRSHD